MKSNRVLKLSRFSEEKIVSAILVVIDRIESIIIVSVSLVART